MLHGQPALRSHRSALRAERGPATREQIAGLPAKARRALEHGQIRLLLQHVRGCPLDCVHEVSGLPGTLLAGK